MTTLVAISYLVAGALVLAGLLLRRDPRIERGLGSSHAAPASDGPQVGGLAAALARLAGQHLRSRVQALVLSAGRPASDRDRVIASKILLAVAGGCLGIVGASGGVLHIALALLLGLAAFRLPDFLLGRAAAASRREMSDGVPPILDLVSLSVAAGLTPRLALDRVAELTQGRLALELRRAQQEVALGTPWRRALRALAARLDLDDLRRLALTLERSERLGTPVALQLRALARDVRAERRAVEAERARRAPVLMLFPLVFLILPAFIVAAVIPAILVATRGIS